MKSKQSRHPPRPRRARALLVATAGAAILTVGCWPSNGFAGIPLDHDLSGSVEDLAEFGLPDQAPADGGAPSSDSSAD